MALLFYRNPRLLILTVGLIIACGILACRTMPQLEDPPSSTRLAVVTVRFPGADPRRVESDVTRVVEQQVRELHGVDCVESWSHEGIAVVAVRLQDEVSDCDAVWSRLRDKLADIAGLLPPGASPPFFDESKWGSNSLVLALSWHDQSPPNWTILQRLAKELEGDLRFTEGTRTTRFWGDRHEEVRVELDASELAKLRLTVEQVAALLQQSDVSVPSAVIRDDTSRLFVGIDSDISNLQRLEDIPVREGQDGAAIRLGDIATVNRMAADQPRQLALVDGQAGIVLALRTDNGIRIDQWRERVERELNQFRAQLPGSVELSVLFDQSVYTAGQIERLAMSLGIGVVAVAVVICLMMGWRATLPVGVALPLGLLMSIAALAASGHTLNQMSIAGLIVAVGLMIDNPIIIVDDLLERLRRNEPAESALQANSRALAIPLLGSTTTTLLAFAPLVLVPGGVGEFVGVLGLSVMIALITTLFLSFSVVPALTAILYSRWRNRSRSEPRPTSSWKTRAQSQMVRWLSHPAKGAACALVLSCTGLVAGAGLPEQFFPAADRRQLTVEMRLPVQSSIELTRATAEDVGDALTACDGVSRVHWFVGTNAPKVHYSMLGMNEEAAYFAEALVEIDTPEPQSLIRSLQKRLDRRFPAAQLVVREIQQGPCPIAPIELRITGPDLTVLRELGDEARSILESTPGVTHTRPALLSGRPVINLSIDEQEARIAGYTHTAIVSQLTQGLGGVNGGTIRESTEDVPIRIQLTHARPRPSHDVSTIELLSRVGGEGIPLAALAESRTEPDLANIARRNGERFNVVRGYIESGLLPSEVERDFRAQLQAAGLSAPPGYSIEFGGVSAERNSAVGNLVAYFGVLALVIATVLVLTFRSFRCALVISVVALLAAGWGLWGLRLLGSPMGMMAIIGLMGMIGVAINDSIVVLSAMRASSRNTCPEAAARVVMRSSRHVMCTSLTTAAGFLPLLLAGGDFWRPMAVVMVGGIGGATIVALLFTPSAALLLGSASGVRQPKTPAWSLRLPFRQTELA